MFRKMRRAHKSISEEAAKQLLCSERRGIFAVNGEDGYPYAIPVNYFYDPDAGKIWFHGAKAGHKFDSLKKSDKICFTVMGNESRQEGEWAPFVQSVVCFGRCCLVEDADETVSRIRTLATKYYPTMEAVEAEIAQDIRAAQLCEITIEHLTGKQIQEK